MSKNIRDIIGIIILVIIFTILLQIYNLSYRDKFGDLFGNMKITEVPMDIKCAFQEPGCETGDIDGWTLIHGVVYFIIGLIIPNRYLAVIIISVIWEILQPLIGNNSRFIINPLVNLTGYAIGSIIRQNIDKNRLHEKYHVLVD